MLLLMRWTCSSLSFKVMIDWRSGRESSAWRILGTRFSFQPIVAKCWSVLTYCGCRVNYIQHRYQFMFTTTTHCIHYHLLLFTFSYHPLSLRNCICCFIFCYHSIMYDYILRFFFCLFLTFSFEILFRGIIFNFLEMFHFMIVIATLFQMTTTGKCNKYAIVMLVAIWCALIPQFICWKSF